MSQIRILPPEIVNRIAAGEVIERPAAVVKELVENSIDAGATEISVEVEEGGCRRIRVRDNGAGIAAEDLPLAFRSHATSKLALEDRPGPAGEGGGTAGPTALPDLFGIGTLGFRGEALASIASVAEVEAISRAPGAEHAHAYRLRGTQAVGEQARGEGPEPVAGPPGTSIDVRNLFFNTPGRRKFLRAPSTELSHVLEQVVRLALGFPGIRFTLSSQGKRLLECPATSSLRERLAAVVGRERAGELVEVREPDGSRITVRGFVGPPNLHRPDTRGQQFFVDGRWVRDRVLSHALNDAYQGFQIPGQKPLAYLFVEVPAGTVDVNVHPTKSEVRFLDSSAVHRAVHAAVRGALDRSKTQPDAPTCDRPIADCGLRIADWKERAPESVGRPPIFSSVPEESEEPRQRVREATADFFDSRRTTFSKNDAPPFQIKTTDSSPTSVNPQSAIRNPQSPPIQLLDRYILLEEEDGLLLYDQHALHEKVLYEKILVQLRAGDMPRQKLLIPEVVELPVELVPLMEQVAERLGPLGFELEPFGPREMAVHAVPALLDRSPAAPVVLEAARWLHEGGQTAVASEGAGGSDPIAAETRRLAQMVACKQAVKAGMRLEEEEIRALLRGAGAAVDPRFCPHGRPTSVRISRGELDRRFERK
jgi:DNA mismatch repair protein MutL